MIHAISTDDQRYLKTHRRLAIYLSGALDNRQMDNELREDLEAVYFKFLERTRYQAEIPKHTSHISHYDLLLYLTYATQHLQDRADNGITNDRWIAMGSTLKPKYEANDLLVKFNVHTDAPMREFVFARNGDIDLGPVKFSFFAVGKYIIIHFDYFLGNERMTVEVPILFETQEITAYIKKLYTTKEYLND